MSVPTNSKYVLVIESCSLKIIKREDMSNQYQEIRPITEEEYQTAGKRIPENRHNEETGIWCPHCCGYYRKFCRKHPIYLVPNATIDDTPSDKSRAIRSLPQDFVEVATSSLKNAGRGVFATQLLPVGYMFGPYEGERIENRSQIKQPGYSYEVDGKNGSYLIDASDENASNWLRFVNAPNKKEHQNLFAVQFNHQIFYIVTKTIFIGEELLVPYGPKYW